MTVRFAFLAALYGALPALAQSPSLPPGGLCPPAGQPVDIAFDIKETQPTYSYALSLAEIRAFYVSRGNRLMSRHTETMGLTSTNTAFTVEGDYTARGNGRAFCVYLTDIRAEFGLERLEVFVAREFPRESCEHDAVIAHENRHAKIVQDAVVKFAPVVHAELQKAVTETEPRIAPDAEQAGRRMTREIRERLDAVLEDLEAYTTAEHAAIDTTESYDAVMAQCAGWRAYVRGPRPGEIAD